MNQQLGIIILIAVLLVVIFYFIALYNQLILLKNDIQKNWSNIEVLLKQRNSELTKLVDSCTQYITYEKDTLEKITKVRNSLTTAYDNKDILALGVAETEIRSSVRQLFALAENYPNLKADTVFAKLQQTIIELESSISDRREFYNDSVNLNNIAIEQFPTNIVTRLFNFKKFDLLKFNIEETQDINIKNLFNKQ
jgi:LemA protein